MSGIKRTYRVGSITTFVTVGVILVLVLAGTIYFLKQRSEQARKDQAIAIFNQQQADENAKKRSLADNSKKESESSVKSSTKQLSNGVNTADLPRTGPELIISELIGACLLVTFSTSYFMSRRSLSLSL